MPISDVSLRTAELANRLASPDYPTRERAASTLLEIHTGLIFKYVNKFEPILRSPYDRNDLINYAKNLLLNVAAKYDLSQKAEFSTFFVSHTKRLLDLTVKGKLDARKEPLDTRVSTTEDVEWMIQSVPNPTDLASQVSKQHAAEEFVARAKTPAQQDIAYLAITFQSPSEIGAARSVSSGAVSLSVAKFKKTATQSERTLLKEILGGR